MVLSSIAIVIDLLSSGIASVLPSAVIAVNPIFTADPVALDAAPIITVRDAGASASRRDKKDFPSDNAPDRVFPMVFDKFPAKPIAPDKNKFVFLRIEPISVEAPARAFCVDFLSENDGT